MINLPLSYYDNKWILDTKKINLHKASIFCNRFHFTEDFCAIIDHLQSERNFENIYTSKLQLKKEITSNLEASFLDLPIKSKIKTIRLSSIIREVHSDSKHSEVHSEVH